MAQTVEDILKLKNEWCKLQKHPNSDFNEYLWSITEWNPSAEPYVLVSKNENEQVESILVGRKESERLNIRIGYFNLYRPHLKKLTFIYEGLLGKSNREVCESYVKKIVNELNKKVADVAWFNHLRNGSPLLKAATKIPNLFSRDNEYVFNKHWTMNLPHTADEFWKSMSAKHRYWLKRLPKILEKNYPRMVTYDNLTHISQVDKLCQAAESISRKTYQRALGVGYIDSRAMRSRIRRYAEKNQLRSYVCSVDSVPIAFWIGIIYGNNLYLAYTGYDPGWRKYEVGTILFIRMIEDIIQRDKGVVKRIDFGFGDAGYKRRFGDESFEEASVYIYPFTSKGIKLKLIRKLSVKSKRWSDIILRRLKIEEKVKTIWRRRMAADLNHPEMDQ